MVLLAHFQRRSSLFWQWGWVGVDWLSGLGTLIPARWGRVFVHQIRMAEVELDFQGVGLTIPGHQRRCTKLHWDWKSWSLSHE